MRAAKGAEASWTLNLGTLLDPTCPCWLPNSDHGCFRLVPSIGGKVGRFHYRVIVNEYKYARWPAGGLAIASNRVDEHVSLIATLDC